MPTHLYAKNLAEHSLKVRLDFVLNDYCDCGVACDQIVSGGMLGHIGPAAVLAYFEMAGRLLAPGSIAVLRLKTETPW